MIRTHCRWSVSIAIVATTSRLNWYIIPSPITLIATDTPHSAVHKIRPRLGDKLNLPVSRNNNAVVGTVRYRKR